MKLKLIVKNSLYVAVILIIFLFSTATVFCIEDEFSTDTIQTEEFTTTEDIYSTENTEPITEEYSSEIDETENTTEPSEATEPTQTESENVESDSTLQEETTTTQITTYTDLPTDTTYDFEIPTVAKTISTKTYSTNYTAGIVSWICVAIGVLIVAVVLISTKNGAKFNNRNYNDGYYKEHMR